MISEMRHDNRNSAIFRRHFVTVLAAGLSGLSLRAQAESEQQALVREAMQTLNATRTDLQFSNARNIIQRAYAVMVVPKLFKGGFIVGGEGGNAVLFTRTARGTFENPRFYSLASLSFGLQVGLEVADMVFCIMSRDALLALARDQVKLGARAGLTVLVIGSNAEAAATTNAHVDVIAWARAKGVYGGITLEGSVVSPRDDWNTAYYGRPVPRTITG